ncbi:MAG: DUF1524 domain-containing protein [Frankiaceae bacterium]
MGALRVQGRGPRTGYSRQQFGPGWVDTDRNGCDTRNDILKRDLTGALLRSGTAGCVVLAGVLADPYTGRNIAFSKTDASAVQIDHVVALSDAWQMGAAGWTQDKRVTFANDPLNLLAVDGPANMAKGDSDAASWLPPNKSFRCLYVGRQVAVKARYVIGVTAAEQQAMVRVLARCSTPPTGAGEAATTAPRRRPPTPTHPAAAAGDPRFATCRAAIAAGYGPYRRGADAAYSWYRDRDGDGTVCER